MTPTTAITAEIHSELQARAARFAGDPDGERQELYLVGLEREQIVAVGYREALLARRIARLGVPDEMKELMRHALLWTWKDEQMHATYVRGVLLRALSRVRGLQAWVEQLSGSVGGWVASTQQHFRWREAPLSRAVAGVFGLAGRLAGKVPRSVQAQLHFLSFRDYCLGQAELEVTAALVWDRLVALERAGADGEARADPFMRMSEDERNHGVVFSAIADVLDAQDQLVPGCSADTLAAAIGAAAEPYLPRARRQLLRVGHPVGAGGDVHMLEGGPAEPVADATARLLCALDLPALVAARAAEVGKPVSALRVAIKSSFMMGYSQRDLSPVVAPAACAAVAQALRDLGVADVAVVEARNLYDWFFQHRTVAEVARHFGYDSPLYRVVDSHLDQAPHRFYRGLAQSSVCATWRDADLRVNLGKLRSHPVELAYLALGNFEGLGHRSDDYVFVEKLADRSTAVMMIHEAFPAHLSLLEGYDLAPDGLSGMLGSAAPRSPRRLYAATDPLALDLVAARHLGVLQPRRVPLVRAACAWFGDPEALLRVVGPDAPVAGWKSPLHSDLSSLLSLLALPMFEFGSGRGALFVPEMDPAAFPPLAPPGALLRAGRRAVQRLLGLRLPAARVQ